MQRSTPFLYSYKTGMGFCGARRTPRNLTKELNMMTIKGKVLTILLALAFNAFAAEWTGANSEPATTKTIDGKKFYVISSANELAWFAVQVNSGNANINGFLKNDVNLGPDAENYSNYPWTPIGKDSTKLFGGVFDGNGKKNRWIENFFGKV